MHVSVPAFTWIEVNWPFLLPEVCVGTEFPELVDLVSCPRARQQKVREGLLPPLHNERQSLPVFLRSVRLSLERCMLP